MTLLAEPLYSIMHDPCDAVLNRIHKLFSQFPVLKSMGLLCGLPKQVKDSRYSFHPQCQHRFPDYGKDPETLHAQGAAFLQLYLIGKASICDSELSALSMSFQTSIALTIDAKTEITARLSSAQLRAARLGSAQPNSASSAQLSSAQLSSASSDGHLEIGKVGFRACLK